MKRILIAALLCVVLLLTACTSQQEKLEKDANKIAALFDSASQPFFGNKEEYDAFMAKNGAKLPGSFITWEEISTIGEFYSLVLCQDGQYLYTLVDASGAQIIVEVDPYPGEEMKQSEYVSINTLTVGDMGLRKVSHEYEGTFVVMRNGFEYLFSGNGSLYSITWYNDGVKIMISQTLEDYPVNRTDTVVGKLLSADDATAKAAVTEINRKLG